jgi:hypothetical protein
MDALRASSALLKANTCNNQTRKGSAVKPLIPIAVTARLALASVSCRAATDPRPLQPNAPRTVIVSEADTMTVIRAGLLQSTLIVLPFEEKVANDFAGDTVDWIFDGGHVAGRFISVKPKVANGSTDIHIVPVKVGTIVLATVPRYKIRIQEWRDAGIVAHTSIYKLHPSYT